MVDVLLRLCRDNLIKKRIGNQVFFVFLLELDQNNLSKQFKLTRKKFYGKTLAQQAKCGILLLARTSNGRIFPRGSRKGNSAWDGDVR